MPHPLGGERAMKAPFLADLGTWILRKWNPPQKKKNPPQTQVLHKYLRNKISEV